MLRKILFLTLLFFSYKGIAAPKKLDVIFLSHSYVSYLEKLIQPQMHFYMDHVAISIEEAKKTCVPMGDGCFHPQYGMIVEETKSKPIAEDDQEEFQLRTINALETNLVDCKEGYHFDIFCGKTTPVEKPAPIEFWVDISSSMRNVDSDITKPGCYRKTFIKNILDQCPQNSVDVSVYSNSIKLMDTLDTVCLSYGMNSPKRFRDWIEASTAEHLFIITDIDEMTGELRDFLDEKGANIVGIGAKDFSVKDLDSYSKDFLKTCQNTVKKK